MQLFLLVIAILCSACGNEKSERTIPFHGRALLEAGLPPLLAASHEGRASDVRSLLERSGAELAGPNGLTALHLARNAEICRILLGAGAPPDAQDDLGLTPLHLAVSAEVARLLMNHGASPGRKSLYGWTPLHTAAILDRPLVLDALLERNSEVNVQARNGMTPLHLASSQAVADILLKRGANVTLRDRWGRSPLDMAQPGENERDSWRTVATVRVKAQSKRRRRIALALLFVVPAAGLLACSVVKRRTNRKEVSA